MQIIERASKLAFGDGLFTTRWDSAEGDKIAKGIIRFRKRDILYSQWSNPENIPSSLLPSWLFTFHSLIWTDVLRRESRNHTDKSYIEKYEQYLTVWLDEFGTPPDILPTQKEPGDYSWYDMATSWRCGVFVCALEVLGEKDWLINALQTHGQVLFRDDYYVEIGNHALHQISALLTVGYVLNDRRYIEKSMERLEALWPLAVDHEGVSLEGSVTYHFFNSFWWSDMKLRLELVAKDWTDLSVPEIPDMRVFMPHAIAPDGGPVLLGDSTLSNSPLFKVLSDKYPAYFIKDLLANDECKYVKTRGRKGTAPSNFIVFKDGYLFSRDDWTDDFSKQSLAVLRFGAPMNERVHGHEDLGSILYYPRGCRLLEDGGMYGYYGGDIREFVKSNKAHNTVHIQDGRYYRSANADLLVSNGMEQVDFGRVKIGALQNAQWFRTFVHTRSMLPLLCIQDVASTGEVENISQLWQLGDDFTVVAVEADRVHVSGPSMNAVILWSTRPDRICVTKGRKEPTLGWRSTLEGEVHPIQTVSAEFHTDILKVTVLIIPLDKNMEMYDVKIDEYIARTNETMLTIAVQENSYQLQFSNDGLAAIEHLVNETADK